MTNGGHTPNATFDGGYTRVFAQYDTYSYVDNNNDGHQHRHHYNYNYFVGGNVTSTGTRSGDCLGDGWITVQCVRRIEETVLQELLLALKAMQTTCPVWIVMRLCTDDEKVVQYYNSMDSEVSPGGVQCCFFFGFLAICVGAWLDFGFVVQCTGDYLLHSTVLHVFS